MSRPLKWFLTIVVTAGAAALLVWLFVQSRREMAKERDRPIKTAPRVSRAAGGEPVVTLDREMQARIGLKTEPLAGATLQPELAAYGRLEEDPAGTFVLRAPAAGVLRPAVDHAWPAIGEHLADGSVAAALEPRFTPVEQVDLSARLAAARADVDANTASAAAARAAYERTKVLNAEDKNLSDRALQEAEARLKGEEARLQAATETAQLMQASLSTAGGPSGPRPLRVERGGEVVEILARPGEAVESGQPILRVVRFDQLVARVDIPAGQTIHPRVSAARLLCLGHEDRPLRGETIGLAPATDPKIQGQAFLFRVREAGFAVRPGLVVTAYLPLPGAPQKGVIIPAAAVVRSAGAAWIYVQAGDDKFARKQVFLEHPTESGFFVGKGFAAGDRVVTAGAQTLLSEELKSQIQTGEEETAE